MRLGLVDTGSCNLFSVKSALKQAGAEEVSVITSANDWCDGYTHIVLPGVGSFSNGMAGLVASSLDQVIRSHVASGGRFLGICLGMQLLASSGVEGGLTTKGLGLISGSVLPIVEDLYPKVGWVSCRPEQEDLRLLPSPSRHLFYVMHSFRFFIEEDAAVMACAHYDKMEIPMIVEKGNIFGVQFHPEKSGGSGLALLQRFMDC